MAEAIRANRIRISDHADEEAQTDKFMGGNGGLTTKSERGRDETV